MNYTTIEQSKKLLELGLSPESADMFYQNDNYGTFFPAPNVKEHAAIRDIDLPCWSIGALLKVMPQTNKFHTKVDIEFNRVTFEPCDDDVIQDESTFHYSDGKTLIEACYNMIVWLLENNHIERKKDK